MVSQILLLSAYIGGALLPSRRCHLDFYLLGIGVFILTKETNTEANLITSDQFLTADNIPTVKSYREEARQRALTRLAENSENLMNGDFAVVPLPVDVLSEAHRFNEIADKYGEGSFESMQMFEAVLVSSKRALAEAMRSQTWEYFSPLRFDYDDRSKDFYAYGMSVSEALLQGLSPVSVKEEQARRIEEFVENETHVAHIESNLDNDFWYLTISMCAEHEEAKELGYVPELDKMMIRGVHIEEDSLGKYKTLEQLGIPGLEIGDETIKKLLKVLGVDMEEFDRTKLLGTQIMIPKDKFSSVIDIVELIDELSGKELFMGEPGKGDYLEVAMQAQKRQEILEDYAHELSKLAIEQAKNGIDPQLAKSMQIKVVTKMAHQLAKSNPEIAKTAFNAEIAEQYEKAKMLESHGDYAGAESVRGDAIEAAGDVTIGCTGGSCDLVGVSNSSSLGRSASSAGLDSSAGLVEYKKGRCGGCGRSSIVYDMKGNSFCGGCGSSRVGGKINKPSKQDTGLKPIYLIPSHDPLYEIKKKEKQLAKNRSLFGLF